MTHFDSVISILQFANMDLYLSLVKKKKIASLLKIPFLDEEAPSNSFPRKVCGMFIQLQFE